MNIKFGYIVCIIVIVCILGIKRNAECSIGNIFWGSIFGGWGYWVTDDLGGYDSDGYYLDFYCTMGIQIYRFDVSASINPFALIVALVSRGDIGIRIYETDNFMVRIFAGFGNVYGNEKRKYYINDYYIHYFAIGVDLGFTKINFENCCCSLIKGESRIFISFYFQRMWGSNKAYDSIVAGIGSRW